MQFKQRVSLSFSLFNNTKNEFNLFSLPVLKLLEKRSVVFVRRRFWTPFFEQVVFAVRVLEVTSVRDESPVGKRRFRLFD